MPVPYNMSELTNKTSLLDLAKGLNNMSTSPWLSFTPFMLIIGFIILFLSLSNWGAKRALAASSFTITIMSLLLWAGGVVADLVLYLFIILTVVSSFILVYSSD